MGFLLLSMGTAAAAACAPAATTARPVFPLFDLAFYQQKYDQCHDQKQYYRGKVFSDPGNHVFLLLSIFSLVSNI
jgi:hypothetical protein